MAWSSRAGSIQMAGHSRRPAPAPPCRPEDAGWDRRRRPSNSAPSVCQRPISIPRSEKRYFARPEAQLSLICTGGIRKAHLRGEMAAQRAHPVQQLASLFFVHQRNQLKANLQGQLFQAQQVWRDRCSAPRPPFSSPPPPARPLGLPGAGRHPAPGKKTEGPPHPETPPWAALESAHGRRNQAGHVEGDRLGK